MCTMFFVPLRRGKNFDERIDERIDVDEFFLPWIPFFIGHIGHMGHSVEVKGKYRVPCVLCGGPEIRSGVGELAFHRVGASPIVARERSLTKSLNMRDRPSGSL